MLPRVEYELANWATEYLSLQRALSAGRDCVVDGRFGYPGDRAGGRWPDVS